MEYESIKIIPRAAWGALKVSGKLTEHKINTITLHHTGVALENRSEAPLKVKRHQDFHINSRGWPDLAYHFIVDTSGHIYEGRDITKAGDSGTNYDPTGHLLICAEGNFEEQVVTDEQYETLVKLMAWGSSKFELSPDSIKAHRDYCSTLCPGSNLYGKLVDGSLIGAVKEKMESTCIELEVIEEQIAKALIEQISSYN